MPALKVYLSMPTLELVPIPRNSLVHSLSKWLLALGGLL